MKNTTNTTNKTNRTNLTSSTIYFCLCLIIIFIVPTLAAADETYRFERLWPVLPQPWYFNHPEGVAIDNNGNIYVTDTGNNRVEKFNADGFLITTWGTEGTGNSQFKNPSGIAVDTSGNVYVSDTHNYRVQKFNANGEYLFQWGEVGSDNGQFARTRGIAVDSSGNVYVTDDGSSIINGDSQIRNSHQMVNF